MNTYEKTGGRGRGDVHTKRMEISSPAREKTGSGTTNSYTRGTVFDYDFFRFPRENKVFTRRAVRQFAHATLCRFDVFYRFHPNRCAEKVFPEYIKGSGSHRTTLLRIEFRTGFLGGRYIRQHSCCQPPRFCDSRP